MDLYQCVSWIVIETYTFSNRNGNNSSFSNRHLPSFFTSISFIASRQELYFKNYKNNNEPKKLQFQDAKQLYVRICMGEKTMLGDIINLMFLQIKSN